MNNLRWWTRYSSYLHKIVLNFLILTLLLNGSSYIQKPFEKDELANLYWLWWNIPTDIVAPQSVDFLFAYVALPTDLWRWPCGHLYTAYENTPRDSSRSTWSVITWISLRNNPMATHFHSWVDWTKYMLSESERCRENISTITWFQSSSLANQLMLLDDVMVQGDVNKCSIKIA